MYFSNTGFICDIGIKSKTMYVFEILIYRASRNQYTEISLVKHKYFGIYTLIYLLAVCRSFWGKALQTMDLGLLPFTKKNPMFLSDTPGQCIPGNDVSKHNPTDTHNSAPGNSWSIM